MKNFLMKYNANKLETSKDEGLLTLEKARERILKLLTENMKNFKDNSWDISNRMNKLMTDTEKNSIFTLRLGGKRIVRYSLDLLSTEQKLQFLADFYTSVANKEFDEDITDFLAKEIDNASARKKEANERRREKKKAEREKKAKEKEVEQAAQGLQAKNNEYLQIGCLKSIEPTQSLKNQGLAKNFANPLQIGALGRLSFAALRSSAKPTAIPPYRFRL